MCSKFPQTPQYLYRDSISTHDDRYHREDIDRSPLPSRPRDEENQARPFQQVNLIELDIAEHSAEKFAKKLLGETEVEAVLRRLDRLTQDEARMTGAQTLEVVHGLVNNMKVVMNGTQRSLSSS